ncbi:acyl-CoA dehydrogenase family protein [Kitasatospora griseola]|uniref:acyl-CoA dehydrogenase family protein n=1 Tax=Kitasatospora griseola TaxID=2064 RepID=UPI0005C492EC|nr:acyl-CoA dehydrogenase family protein [Kitasatospora griseola]
MTEILTDDRAARAALAAESAGRYAREADRSGALDPETVKALTAAGYPRHFVPARWGGAEGTFTELTAAMTRVGRACASAAWCGSMFAYSARFSAHLPLAGQEEAWGDSPDVLWVSGLVPSGRAEAVDGGFRLDGRWSYVSGALFADWALLAGPTPGPGAPPPRFFAVPRADFAVEESWDTVGMRATGSHTVVLSDVWVPEHRTVPLAEVVGGVNRTSDRPQHAVPLMSLGGLTCLAPVLGAAAGMVDAYTGLVAARRSAPGAGPTPLNDQVLARAAAEVDAATLLAERAALLLDQGRARPFAARNARDTAHAARVLVDTAHELVRTAGTAAQDAAHPLQRHWRDITVAATHAALRFDRIATAYTDAVLAAR